MGRDEQVGAFEVLRELLLTFSIRVQKSFGSALLITPPEKMADSVTKNMRLTPGLWQFSARDVKFERTLVTRQFLASRPLFLLGIGRCVARART